ncbi:hypothetical protein CC1G_14126 [Coprinopsis cinerea okayama7|uniref:Uncharacterized protein n=1 Tax=Coprinopsis cinerea (strain Okayama-7 / 130 / ATCC MYA-4618 / FGSC 9003) TaxID=240176 RepID=D6RL59_COPC7|nr:hypothetical protein CC1G_14126 [Coprinopsis cinerea okayama7\|eukprot:XP_002911593.1 hypothetical protein CC1G_14126 [Coprinopsis cinerea okayama7\
MGSAQTQTCSKSATQTGGFLGTDDGERNDGNVVATNASRSHSYCLNKSTQASYAATRTLGGHTQASLKDFPQELLARIFLFALERSRNNAYGRRTFSVLRSVCKSWNAVTLSNPRLWSTLTLDCILCIRLPEAREASPSRIRAWFDHAKWAPLSFQVIFCPVHRFSSDEEHSEEHPDVLSLASDDRNWSELRFCLNGLYALHSLPKLFTAVANAPYRPWKNLTTLRVSLTPSPGDSKYWPFGSRPLDFYAPNLASLRLDIRTRSPEERTISHGTLSHLTLDFDCGTELSYKSLISNLRHLPGLRSLKIRAASVPTPSKPIVTHMGVTSLTASGYPEIIRYLTLPSLKSLELAPMDFIRDCATKSENLLPIAQAFLRRSGCHLSELHIYQWHLRNSLSSQLLDGIETRYINSLSLYLNTERYRGRVSPQQAFIHRLLLLPSIRKLAIFGTAYINLHPPSFIECLEERKEGYYSSTGAQTDNSGEQIDCATLPRIDLIFAETSPFIRNLNLDLLTRASQLGVRFYVGGKEWN